MVPKRTKKPKNTDYCTLQLVRGLMVPPTFLLKLEKLGANSGAYLKATLVIGKATHATDSELYLPPDEK